MMKTIWLTAVGSSKDLVKGLIGRLQPYGLEIKGHLWEDDLAGLAWSKPREELLKSEVSLWLIMTSSEDLALSSIRYGLSLLVTMVQAHKGLSFPIGILLTGGDTVKSEDLPTPLKGADFLAQDDPALGAKLVAKVHSPASNVVSDYRLDVYASSRIGQWLEVGPQHKPWHGAMLGVAGAEITAHAVGPKGSLPDKSVLNYPIRGMKATIGEREYTAWAVQNELDPHTSYFVKVEGTPESIMFGPYSPEDEAEVYVIKLT
ncbi:MAG: hypothetical protein ACMUIA_10405 [bacterium]